MTVETEHSAQADVINEGSYMKKKYIKAKTNYPVTIKINGHYGVGIILQVAELVKKELGLKEGPFVCDKMGSITIEEENGRCLLFGSVDGPWGYDHMRDGNSFVGPSTRILKKHYGDLKDSNPSIHRVVDYICGVVRGEKKFKHAKGRLKFKHAKGRFAYSKALREEYGCS